MSLTMTTLQQKITTWQAIRAEADRLEGEILAAAQAEADAGRFPLGSKIEQGGAILHYSPGRGKYDYEAAVRAAPLAKGNREMLIALNTHTVIDWKSVWAGCGQGQASLDHHYTPGVSALVLKRA